MAKHNDQVNLQEKAFNWPYVFSILEAMMVEKRNGGGISWSHGSREFWVTCLLYLEKESLQQVTSRSWKDREQTFPTSPKSTTSLLQLDLSAVKPILSLTLHPHQHEELVSLSLAILPAITWNLKVGLICISLMAKVVKYFFNCSPAIWDYPTENSVYNCTPFQLDYLVYCWLVSRQP